jgi:hypothetical protein
LWFPRAAAFIAEDRDGGDDGEITADAYKKGGIAEPEMHALEPIPVGARRRKLPPLPDTRTGEEFKGTPREEAAAFIVGERTEEATLASSCAVA